MEKLEKTLQNKLGKKTNGHYFLDDTITVDFEEIDGAYRLWIEDRRYDPAFAWNWDVEKTENGYTFTTTHDYNLKYDSLEKVFEAVRMRTK